MVSIRLVITLVLGVLCARALGAGDVPVLQPHSAPEGHAWLVLAGAREGELTTVLHLPPRGAGMAERGVATPAMELNQNPVRVSAWDRTLYFGFGREPADVERFGPGASLWRIQRVQTERFGRSWMYPPGRPEMIAPLVWTRSHAGASPGSASDSPEPFLAALATGPTQVAALLAMRERGGEDASPRGVLWTGAQLRLNAGRDWQSISLPWQGVREDVAEPPSPLGRVYLAGQSGGWCLASVEPKSSELRLWRGAAEVLLEGQFGPPEVVRWSSSRVRLSAVGTGEAASMPRSMVGVPGHSPKSDGLVLAWTGRGSEKDAKVRLGMIEGSRVRELGEFDAGNDAVVGVQPGAASGPASVAVMWVESPLDRTTTTDSEPATQDPFTRKVMLREVSLETGRELWFGGARMGLTLVTRQYQFIAGGLIAAMIVVMIFVLRPDRPPVKLPEGTEPAGAIRRGLASLVDLGLGAAVAGLFLDVPMSAVLDPRMYLAGELGLAAWGLTVGTTALICTIGEGLAGHSVGKLIAGCMVVSVRPSPGRATWGQALLRNLIRWSLPPLGVLVLLDRDGRHPGDLAGGTAVVVEQLPEPDEE
jgi:uncharacterized RDD family membrane protein YckC